MEGGKDGKEGVRAQTEHVRFRQTKKWREGEGRWLLGGKERIAIRLALMWMGGSHHALKINKVL